MVPHDAPLDRDHDLVGKGFDLPRVGLVLSDVGVLQRTERLPRVAPRPDGLVLLGADQRLAVACAGRGFRRGDEAGPDDGALRAERQGSDHAPTVDDAARRDHGELHRIHHLGHERKRPDLARVPARLGTLGRDHVGPGSLGPHGVLHLPDHHHDRDPVRMHLDDVPLGDGESGNEDRALVRSVLYDFA